MNALLALSALALAVLFVSIIPPQRSNVDVISMLFGSILAVQPVDLWVILGVFALTVSVLSLLWSQLAYATFDSELAHTDGVRVRALEYVLFATTALIVVVSAQVVGVVLMAAYLVIPAAAARLVSRSLAGMTVRAVVIGLVSTVLGLLLSYWLDVPSGSVIILSQAVLFIAAALLGRSR